MSSAVRQWISLGDARYPTVAPTGQEVFGLVCFASHISYPTNSLNGNAVVCTSPLKSSSFTRAFIKILLTHDTSSSFTNSSANICCKRLMPPFPNLFRDKSRIASQLSKIFLRSHHVDLLIESFTPLFIRYSKDVVRMYHPSNYHVIVIHQAGNAWICLTLVKTWASHTFRYVIVPLFRRLSKTIGLFSKSYYLTRYGCSRSMWDGLLRGFLVLLLD